LALHKRPMIRAKTTNSDRYADPPILSPTRSSWGPVESHIQDTT
jgi:hypothetical protein